jgi:hypothetical protein
MSWCHSTQSTASEALRACALITASEHAIGRRYATVVNVHTTAAAVVIATAVFLLILLLLLLTLFCMCVRVQCDVQVRLSHFDPDVFYKFKQVFIDKGPHATEKQQDDVRHDVAKVTVTVKAYCSVKTYLELNDCNCALYIYLW